MPDEQPKPKKKRGPAFKTPSVPKKVYLAEGTQEVLSALALHYKLNEFAAVDAAIYQQAAALGVRGPLLRQTILDAWAATSSDSGYDPLDDPRGIGPHRVLAAMLGEADAQALETALQLIRLEVERA